MVAVGDALRAEQADVQVVYVGTGRGIESRVIGQRGDRLELLDVLPLRGRGLRGFIRGGLRAAAVIPEARQLVRRLAPDVVFSVGGYAAGPVALAARSCGVPVTLLEPNSVLGFTNRLLAPLSVRAYVAFPELRSTLAAGRLRWMGVPLRKHFAAAAYEPRGDKVRLLVLGGSQGAKALNETVPHAVVAAMQRGLALRVVHQTGRDSDNEQLVRQLYSKLDVAERVAVVPFIDDMAERLTESDVVISRAGASSLAELCAVGRAAIIVPYPYAADDHQRHNAESLSRAGAAICVVQAEASVERLTDELVKVCRDCSLRSRMAARACQRGRPHAARDIARDLLAIARCRGKRRALAELDREGEFTRQGARDGEGAARRKRDDSESGQGTLLPAVAWRLFIAAEEVLS